MKKIISPKPKTWEEAFCMDYDPVPKLCDDAGLEVTALGPTDIDIIKQFNAVFAYTPEYLYIATRTKSDDNETPYNGLIVIDITKNPGLVHYYKVHINDSHCLADKTYRTEELFIARTLGIFADKTKSKKHPDGLMHLNGRDYPNLQNYL